MTDKNESTYPHKYERNTRDGLVTEHSFGINAREYAAIHLKVPDSGTTWLDEMIEKARRDEFAIHLLRNYLNSNKDIFDGSGQYFVKRIWDNADFILAASKGEE